MSEWFIMPTWYFYLLIASGIILVINSALLFHWFLDSLMSGKVICPYCKKVRLEEVEFGDERELGEYFCTRCRNGFLEMEGGGLMRL